MQMTNNNNNLLIFWLIMSASIAPRTPPPWHAITGFNILFYCIKCILIILGNRRVLENTYP